MKKCIKIRGWVLNTLRFLAIIAVAIFICTGFTSHSQSRKLNQNGINEFGRELSASKAEDSGKTAANTSAGKTSSKKDTEKNKKPLEGLTICIDAGHGKTTKANNRKEPIAPGSKILKAASAVGTSGVYTKISEESLNLTVSKKLKKALSDKGVEIIMVRETSKCDLTNVERTKLWNSSGADLAIRIHANGINDSKVSGVLMMVPDSKYIKDKEMLTKSAQAGEYILDAVLKHTKAKSRGTVKSTDLTGFNWSKIPVVLLEMGFMTNPQEDKLLNTDSYQNKIVLGIVEGLEKYQSCLMEDKSKNN